MVVEKAEGNELRFKNPEQLLVVVLGFVFWGVGFLDLLGHSSQDSTVFGLYSLPFFILIILYGLTGVFWIAVFVNPKLLSRVLGVFQTIQRHTWMVVLVYTGMAVALFVIFEWDRWTRSPGLQFAAFALVVLAGLVLLFSGWKENIATQRWRKVIAYPLAVIVAVELIIQLLAYAGILPGTYSIGGNFAPYERIYYNEEGFRNGYANRYGWYFPDTQLDDEKERILLVGGSDIQGLQVLPEQQVTALLTELTTQEQSEVDEQKEFISIGLTGFGLSPFIYDELFADLPNLITIDEMVVFFHLGNDFQTPAPSADPVVYTVDDAGNANVLSDDSKLRHDLTHYFLRSFLSLQPVETIRSNYLTPKVIETFVNNVGGDSSTVAPSTFDMPRLTGSVSKDLALTEPGHVGIKATVVESIPDGNNFMFVKDGDENRAESLAIARGMLETALAGATTNGTALRVVTIPAFPQEFYTAFQDGSWDSEIGDYDLFAPERALVEMTQEIGIPLLPMGEYMAASGVTAAEIQQFFYADGQGRLTPEGHAFFADALYNCFYADEIDAACSN
jgi:hypothetical protein